ncbi:MAG: DUF1566 domain-containing protein [Deltaproteobacteria bacterium]|nr:DUF1566 domain-containing protein [Deltaproteobacteria bacterium]
MGTVSSTTMIKKWIFLPLLILLATSLLSACGGGGELPWGGETGGPPAGPTATPAGKVSVTYGAGENGAIEGPLRQVLPRGGSGRAVTAAPAPGYHFAQWSDGSTANPRTDRNVTADLAVTARFELNRYTLSYTAGKNGAIEGAASQTVDHGGDGSAVTAVPAVGHHFVGWSDGLTAATRAETAVKANLAVTANFAVNQYVLSYAAGDHGSVAGARSQKVNHGRDGTAVTAVPDPRHHFVGWSDGVTTATRVDRKVTSDTAVTAQFALNRYTLTFAGGENGAVSGAASQVVEEGLDASPVVALPAEGYHFAGWSDGVTTASRAERNVAADLAVTARFEINRYALTYSAEENGSIAGAAAQVVEHGADGTPVTATPAVGHHFTGWSDGQAAATRTDRNLKADAALTARFEINRYSATYVAGEKGSIQGQTRQTVPHGADAGAVTAVPSRGYHFVSWSDGLTTAGRTDRNLVGDLAVSAAFEVNTYTVGGSLSGLVQGTTVSLQNGGDTLALSGDGPFTFSTALLDGTPYAVTVSDQPRSPNQTCTVGAGAGSISEADVTDVTVTCVINRYSVGGTVFGLPRGSRVVLQNNGGDDLVVRANGEFAFPTALEDGSAYEVTIQHEELAPRWFCLLDRSAGTLAGSDVRNVDLACFPEAELQALPGVRKIDVRWNSSDYRDVVFNLCRAEEDFSAGGFGACKSARGAVVEPGVKSPHLLSRAAADTAHWLQLELEHPGNRRTYSKVAKATPFGGLNDTGIDWCADGASNRGMTGTRAERIASCQSAFFPGQDAASGRDADALARNATKTGHGAAGFDFTKVCRNGRAAGEGRCPPNPSPGTGETNWACTRDNVTGLLWELKMETGLHGKDHTYTWYNPDKGTNGGDPGVQNGGKCTGSHCDTHAFIKAVNATGLCGAKDWRLPTRTELLSIVNNGLLNPAVDPSYFPKTPPTHYWTSSPYVEYENAAWRVYFYYGDAYPEKKSEANAVRLVRGKTATFGLNNP